MIDEGEGMRLLHLIAQLVHQAQEELGDGAHGCADIEEDDEARLEALALHLEFERHTTVALAGTDRALCIELALLAALLTQGGAAAKAGGEAAHLLAQHIHLALAEAVEIALHQIVNVLAAFLILI